MIGAGDVPVRDFTDPATCRLISTAYIGEPALAPLADSEDALAILEQLEGMTSARTGLARPAGIAADELLAVRPGHYGATLVNAAFCHTRPGGNRFNGPERGAWYAAYGENASRTARQEVAYHLTQEIEATGVHDNVTCYRELMAGFSARFHDLTGCGAEEECLSPDPRIGYPAGQRLAQAVLKNNGNGVLYPSVRDPGGTCLAAFHPRLVQNVRQGDTWVFTWTGRGQPTMTRR